MTQLIVWLILHLGAWALILLAAIGVGQFFLRRHRFDSLTETFIFTLALGFGLSALMIFGLGLVGLLYEKILLGLTIAAAWPGAAYLIRLARARPRFCLARSVNHHSFQDVLVVLLIATLIGYWPLVLTATLYPPVQWDAISHHLVLSRAYLVQHRLVAVAANTHPALAALNHMLFVWGMALQDDVLAQMIEHTFLMLTAIGLYAWGKRTKKPFLGLAVAAFWLGHPLVLWLGESAYVDVCLIGFVFLGVYALRIFWEGRETSWWYLSMALLGMAAGTKLGGVFFLSFGLAVGIWVLVRHRRAQEIGYEPHSSATSKHVWKPVICGAALGFAIAIPWYVFVAYHTGTPIYPITSPAVATNLAELMNSDNDPRTISNFLLLPLHWIRYPSRFYAESNFTLSPLIVLWPVAWVVAFWDRSVRWWTLWALSFTVYWFLFPHQLRYWLPALPLAGLALFESIQWGMQRLSRSTLWHSGVWTLLTLISLWSGGSSLVREFRFKGWPPTNPTQREAFLPIMEGYDAARFINEHASEQETVGVLAGSWLIYYLRPKVEDLIKIPPSQRPDFRWPEDEQWVRYLESRNITWVLVTNLYASSLEKKTGHTIDPRAWPDYELVYSDSSTWVFRRRPNPPIAAP